MPQFASVLLRWPRLLLLGSVAYAGRGRAICRHECQYNCSVEICGHKCCEHWQKRKAFWMHWHEVERRRRKAKQFSADGIDLGGYLAAPKPIWNSPVANLNSLQAQLQTTLRTSTAAETRFEFYCMRPRRGAPRNRTYNKKMYIGGGTTRGWRKRERFTASNEANALSNSEAKASNLGACELSGRSAPKMLLAHANQVEDDARSQLSSQGLRYSKTCLFTSLTDDNEQQYVIGHQTFMASLLQQHPNLWLPMIVMELGYGAPGNLAGGLKQSTRDALREQYPPTFYVKPIACPEVPFQWPLLQFSDGTTATVTSSKEATAAFYRRLQLFTYRSCGSIVSIDTSDMLVLKPIPHLLIPFRVLNGTDFAAAERCDSRLEGQGSAHYFNAGLYLVGKRHLNAETYASLISVAMSPRQPSAFEPKRWAADQDVLNAYFDPLRGGQDRTVLGYLDNYAKRFANKQHPRYHHCKPLAAARLLHFLGPKPWVQPSTREPMDLQPYIIEAEKLWLSFYFREKTIVVGGGPSVKEPAGLYIDMFKRVVRINDYVSASKASTGLKTTDVVIHKATKQSTFSSFSKKHILLADFGDNETEVEARMTRADGSGLRLDQVTRLPAYYYTKLKQEMALAAGVPYYDAVLQLNEPYHPLSGTIALAWALRTTTERPVYFIGFDMMLGAEYSHGSQQSASRVSRRSLSRWHRIDYDRALLHKLQFVDKAVRKLDVPIPAPPVR